MELSVGLATAAVCGLLLSAPSACDAVALSVGGVSLATAIAVLWWRPYDTALDTLQSVTSNLLAALGAAAAVFLDVDDDTVPVVLWAQTGLAALSLLMVLWGAVAEFTTANGTVSHRALRLILQLCTALRVAVQRRKGGSDHNNSSSGSDDEDGELPPFRGSPPSPPPAVATDADGGCLPPPHSPERLRALEQIIKMVVAERDLD